MNTLPPHPQQPAKQQGREIYLPDLRHLFSLAQEKGELEALVGQRHYAENLVLQWDQQHGQEGIIPIYHAYGMGGAGLTLAPAVAEKIAQDVCDGLQNQSSRHAHQYQKIIIIGAGYTGIFSALALRQELNLRQLHDVKIQILAPALPKGISSLIPGTREPQLSDNYSSQIAGGLVMPVSVGSLEDKQLWSELIHSSHSFWDKKAENPLLSHGVKKVQALLFSPTHNKGVKPDFGIHSINRQFPPALYPSTPNPSYKVLGRCWFDFHKHSPDISEWQVYPFHGLEVFDHCLQVDTSSLLLHYTRELLQQDISLTQLPTMITNLSDLQPWFSPDTHNLVINATGHGAVNVFHGPPTRPIRGDLLVLKIPLKSLTTELRAACHFSFLCGHHYIFLRHELNRPWIQIVLGGSFLENNADLRPSPRILREICQFWLDFVHNPPGTTLSTDYSEKRDHLIRALFENLF